MSEVHRQRDGMLAHTLIPFQPHLGLAQASAVRWADCVVAVLRGESMFLLGLMPLLRSSTSIGRTNTTDIDRPIVQLFRRRSSKTM